MGAIYLNGDRYPGPISTPTSTELLLADYDFTQENNYLVDKINPQKSVTISSNLTHDGNGLFFPSSKSGVITLPYWGAVWSSFKGLETEIDVGGVEMETQSSNIRFLMSSTAYGFIFRGTTYQNWALYTGSWGDGASDTNINTFANSTIKMKYTNDGKLQIYKNNTLFYEYSNFTVPSPASANFLIGASSEGIYNTYIKAIRLYAKQ